MSDPGLFMTAGFFVNMAIGAALAVVLSRLLRRD